ncbi:MAG: hypothetical protein ACI9XR_000296 [Flavobacterium sp.]|jgi:uncharacterized protein (DUF1800 family)
MASLSPNNSVLGEAHAKHLIRRATFVYTKDLINQLALLTPLQALDVLSLNQALLINFPFDPLPTNSPDGFWTESTVIPSTFSGQTRKVNIVAGWWWYNAIKTPTLQYKLSHFLSTRFTVEKNNGAGTSTEFYDHLRLLMQFSYGNYKTLAKKMTLDNSMLNYLNNTDNINTSPNENYAREFLELFTIGKGDQVGPGNYTTYTENDIVETAKVLTGFKRKSDRSVIDNDTNLPKGYNLFSKHNIQTKTFSSAFNNTTISPATDAVSMDIELNAFVSMVFNQQNTAKNICRKIYRYFVRGSITAEIETDIITPLAQDLYANGYEILPVVRKLLESQHFYDLDDTNATDEIVGGMIKSPIQQISEICTYLHATIPSPNTEQFNFYYKFWNNFIHNSFLTGSNMILFNPDNVAGHPAYHQEPNLDKNWISASTLIARYRMGESMLDGVNRISGNSNFFAKINISDVIKNTNIISDPSNSIILTTELCNALFAQTTNSERVNYFMNTYLLQGLADYYWASAWNSFVTTNDSSVVEPRLKIMLKNILRAPESQIF